jgi:hypothetical protein
MQNTSTEFCQKIIIPKNMKKLFRSKMEETPCVSEEPPPTQADFRGERTRSPYRI